MMRYERGQLRFSTHRLGPISATLLGNVAGVEPLEQQKTRLEL